MRVYLAGPIRGVPHFNAPAFNTAATKLREAGHEVFNPAEHDVETFGQVRSPKGSEITLARKAGMTALELRRMVFKADTAWLCENADAVALLPNWQNSKGATAEHALALALGIEVIFLSTEYST